MRQPWIPAFDLGLADSVAQLADGTDGQIVGWVTERGYLGIHDDERRGETIEEMRDDSPAREVPSAPLRSWS